MSGHVDARLKEFYCTEAS